MKTCHPPVIVAGSYPSLIIDPLYEEPEPAVLDAREDLYSNKFFKARTFRLLASVSSC